MNNSHATHNLSAVALALAGFFSVMSVDAADVPDAGRVLKENAAPTLTEPRVSPNFKFEVPAPLEALPGGASVALQSVTFVGNTRYDVTTLSAALGDVVGQSYDLAGLKGLANRITLLYRSTGYPFARAFVPVQPMTNGTIRIEIVEGNYGQVKAIGDASLTKHAQEFLSPLHPGSIIESSLLERVTLILDDQPGIKVSPIIRPAQEIGAGDLDVSVERTRQYGGDLGLDNYGNRYTGSNRFRANAHLDSPFTFGDQINASTLYTDENMWNGNLGYSLPLGSTGLRGSVAYAHTYYQLGKEFADSKSHGTADIASAGFSYPLIRSQQANLSLSATAQHKWLSDQHDVANTRSNKTSDNLPVALNFDVRDSFAGGGVSYGSLSWTHGYLHLDSGLKSTDSTTAKTEGEFDKFNLDLARLQSLPGNFTLFGKLSAQWAANNLDSSEGFGLGGPNGVRAYPTGEAYGNEGWLTQLELRYAAIPLSESASVSPFVFYDCGTIIVNHNPWGTTQNTRSIGGVGVGARTSYKDFSLDASLAWHTDGGTPTSDTHHDSPILWVSAGWQL